MASSPELETLQRKLESKYKIYKLRDALGDFENYDDIIIDTPPDFHFYALSALIAARKCLIPFDCDDFSRRDTSSPSSSSRCMPGPWGKADYGISGRRLGRWWCGNLF